MPRPDTRAQDLKAIHAMARELALTDDCYRALVSRFSGGRVDSSAAMTAAERGALKTELRRLGAGKKQSFRKPTPRANGAPSRPATPLRDSQQRMIRGLWLELAELSAIKDSSEAALADFVKRQTGVDAVQFLRAEQAEKIITPLKSWVARIKKQRAAGC